MVEQKFGKKKTTGEEVGLVRVGRKKCKKTGGGNRCEKGGGVSRKKASSQLQG